MNIKTYLSIIERRVSRESANLHPQAIFEHDSAPGHKPKIITQYFKSMKMEVLDWFGNSLDLNLTEKLWSVAKNRWKKLDCTTKMILILSVIHTWFYENGIKNTCKK